MAPFPAGTVVQPMGFVRAQARLTASVSRCGGGSVLCTHSVPEAEALQGSWDVLCKLPAGRLASVTESCKLSDGGLTSVCED